MRPTRLSHMTIITQTNNVHFYAALQKTILSRVYVALKTGILSLSKNSLGCLPTYSTDRSLSHLHLNYRPLIKVHVSD